jgi:toxin FitB
MSFLLDTNVVSEWAKPRPDLSVVRWLDDVDEDSVYLSSLTLGELRQGVDALAPGRRRDQLDQWLAVNLPERFAARVLAVDATVAERWGSLRASAARSGRTLPVVDSLIAATALEHGLAVVTRNVRDFQDVGVRLVDPWACPIDTR